MSGNRDSAQRLIICRGVPASGKSTFAKAWVHAEECRVRVNRDDIRMQMFGKLVGANELLVTRIEDRMVEVALKSGYSVIDDATNINHEYCQRLANIAHERSVPVEIKHFDISLEEAFLRNQRRHEAGGNFVPVDVIRKMYNALQESGEPDISPPKSQIYYPPFHGLKAILVDIDGTIAAMGDRSPYAWNEIDKDTPHRDILKIVQWAAEAGYQVLFMSGRDEVCRSRTLAWLDRHGIWFDRLFMRPEGDNRKDSVVKRELFDKYVRDEYQVLFVLDDRQQVVDMWRNLGLRCLQVAPGDF